MKRGSVILEELVIPLLQLSHMLSHHMLSHMSQAIRVLKGNILYVNRKALETVRRKMFLLLKLILLYSKYVDKQYECAKAVHRLMPFCFYFKIITHTFFQFKKMPFLLKKVEFLFSVLTAQLDYTKTQN